MPRGWRSRREEREEDEEGEKEDEKVSSVRCEGADEKQRETNLGAVFLFDETVLVLVGDLVEEVVDGTLRLPLGLLLALLRLLLRLLSTLLGVAGGEALLLLLTVTDLLLTVRGTSRRSEAALLGRVGVEGLDTAGEVRRLTVTARNGVLLLLTVLLLLLLTELLGGRAGVGSLVGGGLSLVGGVAEGVNAGLLLSLLLSLASLVLRLVLELILLSGGLVLLLLQLVALLSETGVGDGLTVVASLTVGADPLVRGRGLVDLTELLVGGAGGLGGLDGSVGSDVATEEADVLEELSRLRVGENQLSERTEVLDGLVGVVLDLTLVGAGGDVLDGVEGGSVGLLGVVAKEGRWSALKLWEKMRTQAH